MKKFILLLLLAAIFNSCERIDFEPEGKIIPFIDARAVPTPIVFADDITKKATVIYLHPETLVYNWLYDSYSYGGGLVKTKIFFGKLKPDMQIIIIGQSGLSCTELIILKDYRRVASYKFNAVTIRYLKLLDDNKSLLIRYNNTWTRTGPLADEEKIFDLP